MNEQAGAPGTAKWLLGGLGILIALIGLVLAGGGAYLSSLGGSWYFLLMGLAMLVSGVLIARRKPLGAWLYAVALVLTAIWAVWDAGLDFWPLEALALSSPLPLLYGNSTSSGKRMWKICSSTRLNAVIAGECQ